MKAPDHCQLWLVSQIGKMRKYKDKIRSKNFLVVHCSATAHINCRNCIILLTWVNISPQNIYSLQGSLQLFVAFPQILLDFLPVKLSGWFQNIHPCLLHKCTEIINPTQRPPVGLSIVSLADKYFHEYKNWLQIELSFISSHLKSETFHTILFTVRFKFLRIVDMKDGN